MGHICDGHDFPSAVANLRTKEYRDTGEKSVSQNVMEVYLGSIHYNIRLYLSMLSTGVLMVRFVL